jgi:hypothetical protein
LPAYAARQFSDWSSLSNHETLELSTGTSWPTSEEQQEILGYKIIESTWDTTWAESAGRGLLGFCSLADIHGIYIPR